MPPMISLAVITRDEFPNGGPERLFAKQDHPIQAGFLNAADAPFGVAVRVR